MPSAGHAEKYPDALPRDAENFVAFVKKTARLSERAAVHQIKSREDFEEQVISRRSHKMRLQIVRDYCNCNFHICDCQVLNDPKERFWVLLLTHTEQEARGKCPYCAAAGGLLRHLSASLKAVAGVGRADCADEGLTDWCDEVIRPESGGGESAGGGAGPPRFPHVRMFQTGR